VAIREGELTEKGRGIIISKVVGLFVFAKVGEKKTKCGKHIQKLGGKRWGIKQQTKFARVSGGKR